jgi:hypothetical protein
MSSVGQPTRPVRDTTDTTHSGTQPLALNAAEGIHATFGGTTKVSVQNIQNKYMNMFLLDLVITVLIITSISYNDLGISCYRDISFPPRPPAFTSS